MPFHRAFALTQAVSLISLVSIANVARCETQTVDTNAVAAQQTQVPARITENIDASPSVPLEGSVHPFARKEKDQGRVDANLAIGRVMLLLKPSSLQQKDLTKLISAQHDPASPEYRHWLSPEDYAAHFGVAHSDQNQIVAWLSRAGFTNMKVARGGQWIEFSGTAAQVEGAFHTEIHNYLFRGEKHIANASPIWLPRALVPVVSGLVSLHDFRMRRLLGPSFPVTRDPVTGRLKRSHFDKSEPAAPSPEFTNSDDTTHFLTPGDWSVIYNTKPLLEQGIDGSGVSIAIVGADSDVQLSDIRAFRQIFKLAPKDPLVIVDGTDPGLVPFSDSEVEADLDIEWAGALAPQANIKFVTSATTAATSGFFLSMAHIIDNRLAPIMSVSIGECEMFLGTSGNAFLNSAYQQATAEGISIIAAAGDTGAAGCDPQVSDFPAQFGPNVNGSASTPYDTAVGGTEFSENGQDSLYWKPTNGPDLSSAIGYIPESVWNESCDPTLDASQCANAGSQFRYVLDAGSGGPSNCIKSNVVVNPDGSFSFTCLAGYPKPTWQSGVGVPADSARDLPDVSLNAASGHDGYLVCVEGFCQTTTVNGETVLENALVVGGTSAGAPSLAGAVALLEQKTHSYQGLLNFNLYKLAASDNLTSCNSTNLTDPTQQPNCLFYDTTAGDNNVPGQVGATATPGYDLATGLGSLNIARLVAGWASATKLRSGTKLSLQLGRVIVHGQPVEMRIAVKPVEGNGVPSGNFSLLTDRFGSLFGGSLTDGSFAGHVSDLPGGDYRVRARYSGDAMFSSSESEPVHVVVTPEDSELSVAAWAVGPDGIAAPLQGAASYGQRVGLQITIRGKSGAGAPSGSVLVSMAGTTLGGPYTLNQAGNVFVWLDRTGPSGLLPGTHSLVVSYDGDQSFKPAQANPVSVLIHKNQSVEVIAFPLQSPLVAGVPIDFSISLGTFGDPNPFPFGELMPTGTVQLHTCNGLNGTATCTALGPALNLSGSGPLGAGQPQAMFRRAFASGEYFLRASYSGDANYGPVSVEDGPRSRGMDLSVESPPQLMVRLTQTAPGIISIGKTQNYLVVVKPSSGRGPAATGTVTLFDMFFDQLSDSVTVLNGTAAFTVPWYQAGEQIVFADYSGDNNYEGVATPSIMTAVRPAAPTVLLTPATTVVSVGTQTTLVTLVGTTLTNSNIATPAAESGMVEYWDAVNGSSPNLLGGGPQFLVVGNGNTSTNVLPVFMPEGENVITAKFLGTSDWAAATSRSVAIKVNNGHKSATCELCSPRPQPN